MNHEKPDLIFYLRIQADVAYKRRKARGLPLTSFEQELQEFFKRLVIGFDTVMQAHTHAVILDGHLSPQEILSQTIIRCFHG